MRAPWLPVARSYSCKDSWLHSFILDFILLDLMQVAGYSSYCHDSTSKSSKSRGGILCLCISSNQKPRFSSLWLLSQQHHSRHPPPASTQFTVPSSTCHWITHFLSGRRQKWGLGAPSPAHAAPQSCVLFSLHQHHLLHQNVSAYRHRCNSCSLVCLQTEHPGPEPP